MVSFWQRPYKHLAKHGCPKCNSSHLETEMRELLSNINLEFEEQKKFDWLNKQSLDFYIPSINLGIECQGKQHAQPITFGARKTTPQEDFETIMERDLRKSRLCKENNVNLIYYTNENVDFPYEVIKNKEDILKKIEEYKKNENTSEKEGIYQTFN